METVRLNVVEPTPALRNLSLYLADSSARWSYLFTFVGKNFKMCTNAYFFRKNLNYLNYIKFLIYWKPRHCSIWI